MRLLLITLAESFRRRALILPRPIALLVLSKLFKLTAYELFGDCFENKLWQINRPNASSPPPSSEGSEGGSEGGG